MDTALISFSATFLGVFLAFGITYFYDRHREAAGERSDLIKVLNTLIFELGNNLRAVSETLERPQPPSGDLRRIQVEEPEPEAIVLPYVVLERSALDTAIHSGKLFLLSEDVLKVVTRTYQRVDTVNTFSQQLLAMSSQPQVEASKLIIESHSHVVADALTELKEELPVTIKRLNEKASM